MSALLWNLRWAARTWRRAPLLAATAIGTLALGVGVTTAVYSVVSGVSFNVLPWAEYPDRVVGVESLRERQVEEGQGTSPAALLDWRAQSRSFSVLAGYTYDVATLTDGDDEGAVVQASRISPDAFGGFGMRTHLGRGFVAADGDLGAEPVVLLSYGLWERRYGASDDLVGGSIQVDGVPATVIGVLRRNEFFLDPGDQLLQPLRIDPAQLSRKERSIGVVGLLAAGVSPIQAESEMRVISERLAAQYPDTDAGYRVRVRRVSEYFAGGDRARRSFVLLFASVTFVLLIVCANVANLLLARAASRVKEVATRSAVGGTRAQIALQLLLESALLAVVALPLALIVGRVTLELLMGLAPPEIGWLEQVFRFDRHVFGFALVATVGTVLVFGLVPALQTSRVDLQRVLKEGGGRGASAARPWVRQTLAVLQLGLAISLLSTSALMIDSFNQIQGRDPGIDAGRLVVTGLRLPEARYPTRDHWLEATERLVAEAERAPGIESAASVSLPPFGYSGPRLPLQVEGESPGDDREVPSALLTAIGPGYLRTVGIELRAGRRFEPTDREGSAWTMLVNQTFADLYLAGQSPLGRRIEIGGETREIVGVVSDYRNRGLRESVVPQAFVPFAQQPGAMFGLVARSRKEASAILPALSTAVRQVDAELPPAGLSLMTRRMQNQLWGARLVGQVMIVLALAALLLAALGVYSVLSYSTAQRAQELSIRSALGAEPRDVAALVLRQALWLALLGTGVALVLSAALSPLLALLLASGEGWSPALFVGTASALGLVALVAAGEPAYRATRADPMHALRAE